MNLIVFGVTARVGCKKDFLKHFLKLNENTFDYEFNEPIIIKNYPGLFDPSFHKSKSVAEQYHNLMNRGNIIRKLTKNDKIFAIKSIIDIINTLLEKNNPQKTQIFLVSSLKRNEEIEELKRVFGLNFFLIGLSSDYRAENLSVNGDEFNELDKRDTNEQEKHGQEMEKAFKKSDFFINIDNQQEFNENMKRFFHLMYSHPFITPSINEYYMFLAYAASTRSSSLSRQVGAVLVSENNDLISIGCNEVPKYGGGQYWNESKNDYREIKKMEKLNQDKDTNNLMIQNLKKKIIEIIMDNVKEATEDKVNDALEKSSLNSLIEFYREEHAEEEAITSCCRNGQRTLNSIMYTTTFPCHLCAKKIVAVGVKKVIYIEPYPKSRVQDMFDDSITVSKSKNVNGSHSSDENKVKFETFCGVGPRRFLDFFSLTLSNGPDLNRKKIIYEKKTSTKPRIPTNNSINLLFRLLEDCEEINIQVNDENDGINQFLRKLNQDIKKFVEIRDKILNLKL